MTIIAFIFLILYILMIFYVMILINKIPRSEIEKSAFKTPFSIIIPFKNEAHNLPALLNSLNQLDYDKNFFEIVFINDKSTDNGEKIIQKYQSILPIRILKNQRKSNSPKKDALEWGIQNSKFNYIITTDADCIIPKKWLETYNDFILNKHPKMIAGPVTYTDSKRLFLQFQTLEFLILQAFTQAGFAQKKPFLANGANLCFEKMAFFEVKGYLGNNHLASGDDVFLLEKFHKKFHNQILFLKNKNALVKTKPAEDFHQLIQQKVRWASKINYNNSKISFFLGLLILIVNLFQIFFIISLVSIPVLSIIFLFFKFSIDTFFIFKINRFYKNNIDFFKIIFSDFLYPFYLFITLANISKGNFEWKDNKY